MRSPRLLSGLRARLLLAFVLVSAGACLATGALTFRVARTEVLKQAQDTTIQQFRAHVDSTAGTLAYPPTSNDLRRLATDIATAEPTQNWRVLATYGSLAGTSTPNDPFPEVTPALRSAVGAHSTTVFQRVTISGRPSLVVGLPIVFDTSDGHTLDRSGVGVFLTVPLSNQLAFVRTLVDAVEQSVLPALVLAMVLALLASHSVLRPVRLLRRATRRIIEGRLDTRLAVNGSDELADLSNTFNEMATALDESITELRGMEAQARRFAADVSHELRTPLAAMSAVTDILDEDALLLVPDAATAVRIISEETKKLVRMVDDLMEMSRFDAGAADLYLDEIDLAQSLRRTLASRAWLEAVDLQLQSESDGLRGRFDPRRLDVIVANLVGNALRHGARPVQVRLSTREGSDTGQWAVIEVLDSGPGIPSDVLPHVFDRFYKSDTARTRSTGSGLGLAITAENVRLHQGTIRAANRPHAGAVFTVELPLRPDAPPADPPKERTP